MADSTIAITAGSGTNIDTRTESTNGQHRQVVVLGDPATNLGVAPVDATKGLAVDLSNTGANTNKLLVTPDLPSGASTSAKQPALGTAGTASSDVITVQGITSMTPLSSDIFVGGSVVSTANPVPIQPPASGSLVVTGPGTAGSASSGVLTVQGIASMTPVKVDLSGTSANSTAVKVDGSAVTQPVSMATNQPVGTVAHDGADSGNPIKTGGRARSSEIAAVANDDRTDFVADLTGKQIVLPYANPENFVSGAITSAMTGTTSTSLIAAPASGLRNYITQITVSNSHATVGTDVIIQDGSGGTTLYTIPAAAAYGGASITFPVPLRQPTTATAIYCANVTTGSSTKVSASGYKGV